MYRPPKPTPGYRILIGLRILNFKCRRVSVSPCALACVGERVSGQVGERAQIYYVYILIYAYLFCLFLFFVFAFAF